MNGRCHSVGSRGDPFASQALLLTDLTTQQKKMSKSKDEHEDPKWREDKKCNTPRKWKFGQEPGVGDRVQPAKYFHITVNPPPPREKACKTGN